MEKAHRQCVSGELFSMLGLKPALGRLLTENDDRVVRGSPYAVISYDYWQARFGRDPKVIGRTLPDGRQRVHDCRRGAEGIYRHRAGDGDRHLRSGEDGAELL